MNKQEAIEKIEGSLMYEITRHIGKAVNIYDVIDIVKQIDELEKPVVPQFVADWYEEHKDDIEYNLYNLCKDFRKHKLRVDLHVWFGDDNNKPIEALVKMKLFGYEVEKEEENEELYLASFRDTNQYLGWNEKLGEWFMSGSPFTSGVEQTRETWEGVGIWNNPAFEIKEVEG